MTEVKTPDVRGTLPFDPTDHEEWERRLRALPLRATVVFAVRCTKRVEPVIHLGRLRAEAYAVGLDFPLIGGLDDRAAAYTAQAASASAYASVEKAHGTAAFAAAYAATASRSTAPAAHADLAKFLELKLGQPGEPGEPIRWNDPRLGPLWPDGEPEWYTQVVQVCREVEEKLRRLPDPNAEPLPWYIVAQMEDRAWLDQLQTEGKLEGYRGEFVIAAEKVIYAHGRSLLKARKKAEQKAQKQGVPTERLTDYFVPDEI